MKRKSYIGQRFGKLVVEEMIYEEVSGRKRASCRCVCDCGNEIITKVDALKRTKKSCGCDVRQRRVDANRKDLVGIRFNRLIVKEMLWEFTPTKCRCVCDCGNTVYVAGADLTNGHTKSCGCYHKEKTSIINTKDWSGVISQHGIKFISQIEKNDKGQWLWLCKCGECGSEFSALPAKVMNGHITSCGCRKRSAQEVKIRNILHELDITFEEQYRFNDCKYKYTLPFDFAIFVNGELSHLIEYDGKQHYQPIDVFGGVNAYMETKKRDAIKNKYCKDKNIDLIRLPYTLKDDEIKSIIKDTIYP